MKSVTFKLMASIGLITLLFSLFLLYRSYSLTNRRVIEVLDQQASIALQFDLSIRSYIGRHVRPLMYELIGEDQFVPETMSTSYVARSIFDDVRKEFPDVILKFSSDNPRNPANQAGPEELKIIETFNRNADLKRWSGEITIEGKKYLTKFRAQRVQESCLLCHGDPRDAPAALLKIYGSKAGFHRAPGEIIGLDMVAIPLAGVTENLWGEAIRTFFVSALGLIVFFSAIAFTARTLITRRLTRIAQHFVKAAGQSDYGRIEPIVMDGSDEISDLASSYNTLSEKLGSFYTSLETKVKERTIELEKANALLKKEISDRMRTEEKLQFTQFAMDHFSDPAFYFGPDARFIYTNKAASQSLGYTREELRQMTVHDIDPNFPEEIWERHWEEIKRRGSFVMESHHRAKDGRIYPVEISLNYMEYEGKEFNCAFARDISSRKQSEKAREQLEAKLQRAQKMEAIGTLAGGVAHDLNNILTGIVGYPDLILMQLSKDSPLRKPINAIQDTGKKAAAIVQDLLTLARRGVAVKEVTSLNQIIRAYLESPEHDRTMSFHTNVRIRTHLEEGLLNIMGSPVHLSKTIMNLVSNAAEAMPEGGSIHLDTFNRYVDTAIGGYDDVEEGDYVVIEVSDTGVGISPEDRERIFEPFYSKKVMGRSGTGLGMAVVWGTVKDHNGYIDIQSSTHGGTKIALYFPVTRKEAAHGKTPLSFDEYRGRGESVLVVDDIKEQREIAEMIISQLGYSVTTVSSGEEAIEHLKHNGVDLLVLDMIMEPGIDGLDTYRRILEFRPGQKAIIASGFSETGRVKEAQRLGAGQYVRKPYTMEKIGIAVRTELDRKPSTPSES